MRCVTGFSLSALYNLRKKTIERGYNPKVSLVIYNMHVKDTERSRRPSISLEKQQKLVAKLTTNWYGREKSIAKIVGEVEVFQSSVAQILKKHGYKKVKPI